MKAEIHPKYFESVIKCACGYESTLRTTKSDIHVEICSNCHPFYTGMQKIVDTGGRVQKFNERYAQRTVKAEQQDSV